MPLNMIAKFFSILLAGSLSTKAQPEYSKGYIVYNCGDTVSTYIYVNPSTPPVDCLKVRNMLDGADRKLSVDTIKSFWVPKFGTFVACHIPLSTIRLNYNENRYWNEVANPYAFLQEVVKGERFSLYKLGNFRYYLRSDEIKEDGGFEELIFLKFDDCCAYEVFKGQLIAHLPLNDTYEKVVSYAEYNDPSLKSAVIHLNTVKQVQSIAKNHKVHFFGGAGITLNRLSIVDQHSVSFTTKAAPMVSGGILWQSSGIYEKFINMITLSYSQYDSRLTGWIQETYNLPSNSHTVHSISPKLAILYRTLDKFKYRLYAGISAAYCKTMISSHINIKSIDYFTAKCYGSDALAVKAEVLLDLGKWSISGFHQLGNAYDIAAGDYQLNPRNSGILVYYNF
jgi:hypothetical protein